MSNGNYSRRATRRQNNGGRLFKILPEAFVFDYAGRQGDLVTLTFRPNPNFQPPSLEARVFHEMEGEMSVDTKQERLAALNGHLMEDVKFGGGLLGHLDKGGEFEVRLTDVAPGQWEMTTLSVDMKHEFMWDRLARLDGEQGVVQREEGRIATGLRRDRYAFQ